VDLPAAFVRIAFARTFRSAGLLVLWRRTAVSFYQAGFSAFLKGIAFNSVVFYQSSFHDLKKNGAYTQGFDKI
jgi:hypothetical protein